MEQMKTRRISVTVVLLAVLVAAQLAIIGAMLYFNRGSDDNTAEKTPETPSIMLNYKDFGAVGDGVTDDFDAIIAAHTAANEQGAKVAAEPGAKYYISSANKVVPVKTDVDFGDAEFIIDDTEFTGAWNQGVFHVQSSYAPITLSPAQIAEVGYITKNQKTINLPIDSERAAYVQVVDANTKFYRHQVGGVLSSSNKQDYFIIDKDGNIDANTAPIWDFYNITSAVVYPLDDKPITIKGGVFTTKVKNSGTLPISRGFAVERANTTIDGLEHYVTGETESTPSYNGFMSVRGAYITVKNCVLTARKRINTGTYDYGGNVQLNCSVINCTMSNDIDAPSSGDGALWGIMGTNYIKGFLMDGCAWNRFDCHFGNSNITIRNSVFGQIGINVMGSGLLLVENTEVHALRMVTLRYDYGSHWDGDIVIRNCKMIPVNTDTRRNGRVIIGGETGQANGLKDYGYITKGPKTVTVDGLYIDTEGVLYGGAYVFADFCRMDGSTYSYNDPANGGNHGTPPAMWENPYIVTETVYLKDITTNGEGEKHILTPSGSSLFMFETTNFILVNTPFTNPD